MTSLRFVEELPPGAHVVGSGSRGPGSGINKKEVQAQLRSRPGVWAPVYDSAQYRIVSEWKKIPGFEVATNLLPNQENVKAGSKKYEILIRWVGVPMPDPRSSLTSTPESEAEARAEALDAEPELPIGSHGHDIPTPPAPMMGVPRPTAFQQSWTTAPEGPTPEIVS